MSSSTIVSIFGFLRLPGQVQRQRRPCHGLRQQRCNGNAAATHVTRTSFRRRLSKMSFPTEFMHQNKYGLAKSVQHSQDAQVSCQLMSTHVNSCQLSKGWICFNRFLQTVINAITRHETYIFDLISLISLIFFDHLLSFSSSEFP